jgi:hypothetical protein
MACLNHFHLPSFVLIFSASNVFSGKSPKVLYYRETMKCLPADYVVLVNPLVRPDEFPVLLEKLRSNDSELQSADEFEVFKFIYKLKDGSRTEWLMQFYNWAAFLTWTLPQNEIAFGDTGMPKILTSEIF